MKHNTAFKVCFGDERGRRSLWRDQGRAAVRAEVAGGRAGASGLSTQIDILKKQLLRVAG
jgi:hypothetical protein